VVFTYPVDTQVDVPTGANVLVTFSDPVTAGSLACSMPSSGFCLVGPNGPVTAMPAVSTDGLTVEYTGLAMDAGASYAVYVGADLAPSAQNLTTGPLVTFATRSTRPRAAVPTLVAINGGDPANPESFRPMLESTTIELLFSEPLDPRTVALEAGAFELVDGSGADVPATILTDGIHVAIDPDMDLTAGTAYTVKVGAKVLDEGGQPVTPATATLTPHDSRNGNAPIAQVLRTRATGDPGAASPRFGTTPNAMAVSATLIGSNTATFEATSLAAELGDPKALGGPIAFTIRRGQRLKTTGLDVKLGGQVESGLSTGEIYIEFLTDGGGRLYRNPHQSADQSPDNARAPLYVDFNLDAAVYSVDPSGNATLAQTVLGVEAVGAVSATDGVLDIETIAAMDLGLLGVTSAPINLDLELITDTTATPEADTTPPTLVASTPAQNDAAQPIDQGIDLIFSEPVDLARLRNGGVLLKAGTATIPTVIESHGSAIVLRPTQDLARATSYQVVLVDVADVAGNALAATNPIEFKTASLVTTQNPVTVDAVHPGVACALVGGTAASPGRCAGGMATDDLYHPFTLAADEPIDAEFTQPPEVASVVLGTACNAGTVRVEQLDNTGACMSAVPGTLIRRDRSITFVPDQDWTVGTTYRLTLVSGTNTSCGAGVLCGITGAASFDPLSGMDGTGAAGGPNLIVPFTATAPSGATYMVAGAEPFTDLNGNGQVDTGETPSTDNFAALKIVATGGIISAASFNDADCIPSTPEKEDCMYLTGAMPVEMQPVMMGCTLPDGTSAGACVPVVIAPEPMYATSMSMTATVVVGITTTTETSVMRVREPASGPVTGYIFDDAGTPKLMVKLDLYLDAPDMSVTLSTHDLHSKPLSLLLEGPLTFLPDGRISIAAANTADVPITINVSNSLLGAGHVDLVMPAGEMKLQLVSRSLRGLP
jgi:hypothetical protein